MIWTKNENTDLLWVILHAYSDFVRITSTDFVKHVTDDDSVSHINGAKDVSQ